MWTKEMFGTDIYHLVAAFLIYCVLGWLVESIYMSFCNKKLTNRGFAKGPFCPIYGFGAVFGYLILVPLKGQYLKLYFAGAAIATVFEFLVGKAMIKFLGELWWDYNDKPFNFQGIICLESTIAWGFYAIGVVQFIQEAIYMLIDMIDRRVGICIICILFVIIVIDYIIQLLKVFDVDVKQKREQIKECYQSIIAKL